MPTTMRIKWLFPSILIESLMDQDGFICRFPEEESGVAERPIRPNRPTRPTGIWLMKVVNTAAYLMWEPDERPPFGPNAYDDACNSPDPADPADNEGVGRRHNGAVTMGFSGHVDVLNFRKWEVSFRKHPLLFVRTPGVAATPRVKPADGRSQFGK